MTYYPLIIVFVFAILNWIAVEKKWRTVEYITKPVTMLAILFWVWQSVGLGGSMIWFTLGVVFCLAGDIFLMLPWDMFIFGLLAFLLGHICYVIGLNNMAPYINFYGIILIVILGLFIWWIYKKISAGLTMKGKTSLKVPVLVYSLVISLMVYSALMTWTRPDWPTAAALFASLGAMLFYVSDTMLALDRFVNPLSHARLKVMTTYHLGQIGIILGAMLQLLRK
jgi:uncharacterized membrane protein YhhN